MSYLFKTCKTTLIALTLLMNTGEQLLGANPFGLNIVDDVQHPHPNPEGLPGDPPVAPDAAVMAYDAFQPTILQYIDDATSGGLFTPDTSFGATILQGSLLDGDGGNNGSGADITFGIDSYVRAYHLQENAAFSNSIGFVDGVFDLSNGANANSLIFPSYDSSRPGSPNDLDYVPPFGFAGGTNNDDVLHSGELDKNDDYVDLGLLPADTILDLFLIPDGIDAGALFGDIPTVPGVPQSPGVLEAGIYPVWYTEDAQSSDADRHAYIVQFLNQSTAYYLVAWEDIGFPSTPKDAVNFRDAFVVLEVVPVPEPGTYVLLASFLLIALAATRSKKRLVRVPIRSRR